MKLGIGLGYSPSKLKIPMDDILFAEKMGFDSVWAAESYGSDAVSVASYVLAQTSKIKGRNCNNANAGKNTRNDSNDRHITKCTI
ncbi:MAG: hypothetical protein Ct9H90mP13_12630 [Pseudomonadota bacterium]|nr:MAG: hypothetical protein Ct9H90mP13_12630 [Pseudomonadota bacterium]